MSSKRRTANDSRVIRPRPEVALVPIPGFNVNAPRGDPGADITFSGDPGSLQYHLLMREYKCIQVGPGPPEGVARHGDDGSGVDVASTPGRHR
jgi:hypothetical protein